MKRIQVVDLVRTVAILAILAIHLTGPQDITQPSVSNALAFLWYKIWVRGDLGVSIFFVVSGFLITGLIASNPHGLFRPDFRDFYVRRCGRILPLLGLVCLAGVIILSLSPAPSRALEICLGKTPDAPLWASIASFSVNWHKILAGIPGLHWSVLWSLSIEEQFYLLYPLLLKFSRRERNLCFFLILLIILGPISVLAFEKILPPHGHAYQNSFAGFNLIAIGCLLYIVSVRLKDRLARHKNIALLLCSSGLFLIVKTYTHQDYKADYWGHFFGPTLLGLGVSLFILGGLHVRFFESKYLSFLSLPGKLSYGGYLFHSMILYFLWDFLAGKNEFIAFFLFSAVVFSVALLSYHFYELPANAAIRKLLGRKR